MQNHAGAEVRAYARGEQGFFSDESTGQLVDAMGRTWEITEDALIAPDGESLPRLSGHLAY